jgi:hypothetical protein
MSYGQYRLHERPADESRPLRKQATDKRLRHVFDNPAHVWAHPRQKDGSGFEQTDARVAGGNWYFKTSSDGTRVIYSYRDSYVIGSRFEHGKKTIFLLRSGKPYSITTSGHMNATRSAVPKDDRGVEVFTVPAMVSGYDHAQPDKQEHAYNLQAYVAEIADAIERHNKARSSYNIRGTLNEATTLTAEVKRYAKTFKLKLPALPKLPKLNAAKLAEIIKREQAREEKAAEKRAAERAVWEAQHQAEVEAWKNGPDACKHLDSAGEPIHSHSDRWSCERQREQEEWDQTKVEKIAAWKRGEDVRLRMQYSEPALLRVRTFGADESVAGLVGCVETSHHVQVPISGPAGAARLFRFLVALKTSGRTYQSNGHSERIGAFTVSSFDGETLVAGCHRILWEEILSVSDPVLAAEQTEAL